MQGVRGAAPGMRRVQGAANLLPKKVKSYSVPPPRFIDLTREEDVAGPKQHVTRFGVASSDSDNFFSKCKPPHRLIISSWSQPWRDMGTAMTSLAVQDAQGC